MNLLPAFICLLLISISAFARSADLILISGNVRTQDPGKPRAEAIAIRNGRIIAVGTNKAVRALAGPETRTIDAKGRLVLPGFNDSHVHLGGIGNKFSRLDVTRAASESEILERVSEYVRMVPRGRWIIGSGPGVHNRSALTSKQCLDTVSPHNPVLIHISGSASAVANTVALRSAGISEEGGKVPGVGLGRDQHGDPTGLISGEALRRVQNAIPKNYYTNWKEIVETASNYAASLGVTSVQDVHSDDLFETLRALSSSGRLKTRVYDCIGIKERQKLISAGIKAATGDAMVRTGCLKGNSQLEEVDPEELKQAVADADKAGLQVILHAIGERANDNALNAFEFAAARNGKRDRRFRIEHAHRMRSNDIGRLRETSVIASMQPHLFYYGPRAEGDNYRSILRSGARIAFGSDASITDFNPLLGIHAAVNASQKQALTVEEAVRAYTLGSAYAEFQEREKGTIEVGKLADLVILSEDIFLIDPAKIDETRVIMTIVGGGVVYDADRTIAAASTDVLK